jgi:4-hydroxy-3-methylbut-2-enyl diphosphate reductase IspH
LRREVLMSEVGSVQLEGAVAEFQSAQGIAWSEYATQYDLMTEMIPVYQENIARLRQRFPHIVAPPKEDICYATQNRQEAVSLLSGEVDLVLVLGSQNSSNSQRLAELARERGKPAYLIDGPQDIDLAWFEGAEAVLITAGASTRSCLGSGK